MHYLSGPIRVTDAEGVPAQPGDLLCVEMCNLGPLPGDEWVARGCTLCLQAAGCARSCSRPPAVPLLMTLHLQQPATEQITLVRVGFIYSLCTAARRCHKHCRWGFTGTFDRENGGGFLTDHFPEATKAIWWAAAVGRSCCWRP